MNVEDGSLVFIDCIVECLHRMVFLDVWNFCGGDERNGASLLEGVDLNCNLTVSALNHLPTVNTMSNHSDQL